MAFFFLRWNQTKYLLSFQYPSPDLCACQSVSSLVPRDEQGLRTYILRVTAQKIKKLSLLVIRAR